MDRPRGRSILDSYKNLVSAGTSGRSESASSGRLVPRTIPGNGNTIAAFVLLGEWFMSWRGRVVLPACLVLGSVWASAGVKKDTIRIKVLDSETRSYAAEDNGVPKNCDGVNYDAYCRSSTAAQVINTLLVQAGDEAPFRVSCKADTRWSRCTPLPRGESFDARKEKRGLTVYYADDKGAVRKQLYTYVEEATDHMEEVPAGGQVPSSPPAVPPVPAAPPVPRPAASAPAAPQAGTATVKCSFSSAPNGAEITLDGKYVGSTPSAIQLSSGPHTVEISFPGFTVWKRDLTVGPGSELTVNAVLEKTQ